VLEHGRGPKIIVFRFRPKAHYRRRTGHRSELTRVRIDEIATAETASKPASKAAAPRKTSAKTAPKAAAPKAAPKTAAPSKTAGPRKAAPPRKTKSETE
jgi:large subunit ribosomal protein L21